MPATVLPRFTPGSAVARFMSEMSCSYVRPGRHSSDSDDTPNFDLGDAERRHIVGVLDETGWKISGDAGAAVKLGIPPSTLRSKMHKLSIQRPA